MNLPIKNIDDIVTFSHGIQHGLGNEDHTPAAQVKVKNVMFYNNQWHYVAEDKSIFYPESAIITQ